MTDSRPVGGSIRIVPTKKYWADLAEAFPLWQVEALQRRSDKRVNEFDPSDLPPPVNCELLERVAVDGWVRKELRTTCPNDQCDHEPTEAEIDSRRCAACDTVLTVENTRKIVYTRDLAPTRDVGWVVVIHGMNTRGAWQEEFTWLISTTWGRSIPVAAYKYGIVIAGVILPWRRRYLQRRLRTKLAECRAQARIQGYGDTPDVIAHSFGTWLFGHLLRDELKPEVQDPLHFGRVVLTGCVLRPDFEWSKVKERGLVEDVLNHYGTKDPVVTLAHWTISDSGPSGRRGFDSDEVINVRAHGLGHCDLLSVERCIIDGQQKQPCPPTGARGTRHLDHSYETYWRPFLTLPVEELKTLPDISPRPTCAWRQAAAPLRGTLFPVVALTLMAALLMLLTGLVGGLLNRIWQPVAWVGSVAGAALVALLLGIAGTLLWRRHRGQADRTAR